MDRLEYKHLAKLGGKSEHRAVMSSLSMPEKVNVVIELQKIVEPILRARGQRVYIWNPQPSPKSKRRG